MNVWRSGRPSARRHARTSSSDGPDLQAEVSGDGLQHLVGVGQRQIARRQQHRQVVEHVGGLLVDALVGLPRGRPSPPSSASAWTILPISGGSAGSLAGPTARFDRLARRASRSWRSSAGIASCGAGAVSPWRSTPLPVWHADRLAANASTCLVAVPLSSRTPLHIAPRSPPCVQMLVSRAAQTTSHRSARVAAEPPRFM